MKKIVNVLPLLILLSLASCSSSRSTILTFDANGGYFDDNENITKIFSKGVINTEVAEADLKIPLNKDENKIFVGWVEENSPTILPENLRYPYIDSTIYAYWLTKVSITYVTNKENVSHSDEIGYEGKYVSLWIPELSDDEGYVFEGWYIDKTFETKFDSKVFPSQDITLYALFENYPTINLHYSENKVVEYNGKAGSKITSTFESYKVEDDETFEGWFYKTIENGIEVEKRFFFDYMPGTSLDLYPKTSKDRKVTKSFDLGNDHQGNIDSLVGLPGEIISKIPSLENIDFKNCTFEGWFYIVDGQEVKFDFSKFPNADLKLTAKWKEYPTISFDTLTLGNQSYATIQLKAGEKLPVLPIPTKDDEEFLYWTYIKDGNQIKFDLKTMPEESVVLIPVFQSKINITLKYIYKGTELLENEKNVKLSYNQIIDDTFITENVNVPTGYVIEGIYDGVYNKENQNSANEIFLPYLPSGDEIIYINIVKEITINVFTVTEATNPLWYLEEQTLSVSNFRKVTTLVGGEGQNIVFDKNLAAKYGYEIEGYYESDDTNNISYDKINNLSIFPYVEDGNLTEINVFIRYIKNN